MAASKPVITAKDSGGPLEFVVDGITGVVAEPNPKRIAEAIDFFAFSASKAEKYGAAGKKHLSEMNLSWDYVVKELTR